MLRKVHHLLGALVIGAVLVQSTTLAQSSDATKVDSPNNAPASMPPGDDGITVSMLNGKSQLKIFGSLSALTVFSTDRPFAPGMPLFLLPGSPFGLDTNTFDIHARQSNIGATFIGPEANGFTPSATFVSFIANDTLTGDSYGLLPYNAYGELKSEDTRIAAGLQNDVFNPRKPNVVSLAAMFTTGNTGSFRSQARIERYLRPTAASEYSMQLALSDPIQSVFGSRDLRIQEDNGWPNVEGRINMGLGQLEPLTGGRKARAFELGASAFVGQVRTTRSILAPEDPQIPIRSVVDCWGFGIDVAIQITESFGFQGELFTGAGLGEYNGGIGQTFDSVTQQAIRSSGGWGEVFVYLTPKLHLHGGYGIDSPWNRAGDTFLLTENQTFFANVIWNWTRNIQISNQVDYRQTNYRSPLLDASGAIFYSEFLWKF
ncbi:MAG: hypothetical protein MUF23_05255 [Pirellula sp.]|nr:hypothetical protein [Pirellula sp.]